MKRIFSVLLVLCMLVGVFALTSCDKDDTPADTTPATTQSASEDNTPAPAPAVTFNEASKAIYDAAKAYYDKHNAADNFEDLTVTSTETNKSVSVEKLEYKDDPADIDEEVKYADRTNKNTTTTTTTLKTKTVDGVIYVEVKEDEKVEFDTFSSNMYVIEEQKGTTAFVTTWTLAKIGEKYYYLVVVENTDTEGAKSTDKYKFEFENANAYNNAVEQLLFLFNERTMYRGFFFLVSMSGELGMYLPAPLDDSGFSFSKNGTTYTINEKATAYGIQDYERGVLGTRNMSGAITFTDGKAVKMENKMNSKTEGADVNQTIEYAVNITTTYSSDLSTTVAEPDESYTPGAWNKYNVALPSAGTFY